MNAKDSDFTQEQLEQFAKENNQIYFDRLNQLGNQASAMCHVYDSREVINLKLDLEESFWW